MNREEVNYLVSFALRRGTSDVLAELNETPKQGEPIFELDTYRLKIGDGITPYNKLQYIGDEEGQILRLQEQLTNIKNKIDTFLADADLSEAAVDTLKEIQNMLNDNTLDLAELVKKIAEFEELHTTINASIEEAKQECYALTDQLMEEDTLIHTKIDSNKDNIDQLSDNMKELYEAEKEIRSFQDEKIREEFAAADSVIATALADEIARVETAYTEADTNLTQALEEEIARAKSAESQTVADAKAYTNKVKTDLLGEGITETFDTLVEIQDWINGDGVNATELTEAIAAEAAKRQEQDNALNTRIDEAIKQHYDDLDTINEEFEKAYDQCVEVLNARIDEEISVREEDDIVNLAEAKAYTDSRLSEEVSILNQTDVNNLVEAKAYTDAAKAELFGEGAANFDTIVKLSAKTQELIDIFPPYVAQQIANSETAMKAYVDQKIGEVENGAY